jgi:hypothetical protein
MSKIHFLNAFTILFILSLLPATAQQSDLGAGPCSDKSKLPRYSVSATSTGDTVEGGVCVEIAPVNRLRNFIYISTTITQSAGPPPASVFGTPEKQPAASGVNPDLAALEGQVPAQETRLRKHESAVAKLDDLLAQLKDFISHSDESVLSGAFDSLVRDIKKRKDEMDDFLDVKDWQPTDDILANIQAIQDRAQKIIPKNDDEKARLDALNSKLSTLGSKASAEIVGSDQAKLVAGKIGQLKYWDGVLGTFLDAGNALPKDPASKFAVHLDVPCKTLFNVNRETAVKLTVGDRIPYFDGQQMSMQTHDALVTVKCASPFSLSAGVAFSAIEQREFAIQQSPASSGAGTINTFGYSARSQVHPMPIAMAHMRIREWDDHRFAVHASLGVAANVQGTDAGGSNAEYLPSLSLSLFRTMFLSAGVQIGKQASLAGGFKVGDQVPAGITSPPIQTSYKAGLGFAITFTKP